MVLALPPKPGQAPTLTHSASGTDSDICTASGCRTGSDAGTDSGTASGSGTGSRTDAGAGTGSGTGSGIDTDAAGYDGSGGDVRSQMHAFWNGGLSCLQCPRVCTCQSSWMASLMVPSNDLGCCNDLGCLM